jgi:hypothetical protein
MVKNINPTKVFVQYRDSMEPTSPVIGRKYTITHSDVRAELFVFIASSYACDKVTSMHDDVKIAWESFEKGFVLKGIVDVDGNQAGLAKIRNRIFLNEMPLALQALRQADRFLFRKRPELDKTPVLIHFIYSKPNYDKTYEFGTIGEYKS